MQYDYTSRVLHSKSLPPFVYLPRRSLPHEINQLYFEIYSSTVAPPGVQDGIFCFVQQRRLNVAAIECKSGKGKGSRGARAWVGDAELLREYRWR